jgi:hypothetical protein
MVNNEIMKQLICVIILSLSLVVCISGQSKNTSHPDFSGTWMFNSTTSKVHGFRLSPDTLFEVSYSDPILKASNKTKDGDKYITTEEFTLYTDSRGEVSEVKKDGKIETVTSKTKWEGPRLVRKLSHPSRGKYSQKHTKEEWFLSVDGKALTRKITITSKYTIAYQVNGKEIDSQTTTDKVELLFVFDKVETDIG